MLRAKVSKSIDHDQETEKMTTSVVVTQILQRDILPDPQPHPLPVIIVALNISNLIITKKTEIK